MENNILIIEDVVNLGRAKSKNENKKPLYIFYDNKMMTTSNANSLKAPFHDQLFCHEKFHLSVLFLLRGSSIIFLFRFLTRLHKSISSK